MGEKDAELLTAQPDREVAGPQAAPEPSRELGQDQVAYPMAVAVIDLLEMVQVEQDDGDLEAVPVALQEQLGAQPQSLAAGVQGGEEVESALLV